MSESQHIPSASSPDPLPLQPAQQRIRTAWTADELMAAQFPDPKWAVPGIISEGVNLLAGPPKVGKSWLSLGLALSVAAGGQALERVEVEAGPVLYLALEDTARRLQTRIRKVLGTAPAPSTLTLATSCPALPQGGSEAIAQWVERHPDARMVIIDVFAKMRGPSMPGASAYDADYAAVGHAKRIADHYGIAIVLVHHVRKAGSDDFLAEVSGTNGLAGAADATLVLKRARGQADGVLHVTGRDVDETEYALRFQPEAGSWQLLEGPAADHTISETRATILRYVRANPEAKPKQIADGTGLESTLVRQTCSRMANDVQLVRRAGGYVVPCEKGGTGMTSHSRHGVTAVTANSNGRGRETLSAPVLYRVTDVMELLNMSRTVIYELIREGRIRTVHEGRSRLIPASAIADYVALLEREARGNR